MNVESAQPEGLLPIFMATENPLTQEVQAADVYFVSPAEYRRLMTEFFDKVTAIELSEAKENFHGVSSERHAIIAAADAAQGSAGSSGA